ncbi:MAG: patatin-like phospholipase family protein [Deltaproteobacteria bacterium]|nr:patatin-like phospholipase family protein [Deltaproteobacteria bacterium]
MGKLAIVLSAGGARGAYEAGVLYYVRKGLPPKTARKNFSIKVGTSVGAINTAAMAALADDTDKQAEKIKDIWFSIRQEDVYLRDFGAATHFLGSTVGGILRNLLTFNPFHLTRRKGPHFNSFLDTRPLGEFLKKILPWGAITKNVLNGPIDAVALNATNLRNGRHELFVKRKPEVVYQGHYPFHDVELGVEHTMASAAIPIVFPAVKVDGTYYADGGLRLFTPMSPAIQLGASSMLVVGLRYRSPIMEKLKFKKEMKEPTIALQLGRLLNGVFLDRIEYDMEQLERINSIVETSEKVYGADYLEKLNKRMAKDGLKVDIASRGLRKIRALEIKPSQSISGLFLRWTHKARKQFKFTALEKLLFRLLDIDPATGSDLLSYLTFAPAYLQTLFDLGYEDAKQHRDQIIDIMNGE